MKRTIYANHLGMIPSTEVAFRLRLDAEQRRCAEEERQAREERARNRATRRREFWAWLRDGLTAARRPSAA